MAEARIGVVGLGTMGLGIAMVYAGAGLSVLATDSVAAARDSAKARMAEALAPRLANGRLTLAERDALLARVQIVEDLQGLSGAAVVIEAIVERLEAKQALLSALEQVVGADAVLATNTSSIPVAEIAAACAHPERVLALHFFNPPTAMKLVELAPHAGTSARAVAHVRAFTELAGKTVIACPDRPGFIVNRCARPFYGEALALLEEGRTAAEIDAAMLTAGYRLGPFALIDLIGADINLAATEGLNRAMAGHPRYHVFAALRAQVATGHLGRKSGQGFVFPAPPGTAPADAAEIVLRIESTLANEAGWLLAEGGVAAPDIDTAMQLGLNFPRGPFAALHDHGRAAVLATLARLEQDAPPPLRGRYLPAPALTGL